MLLAMLALLCVPVGAEVEGEETVAGGVEGETVAGVSVSHTNTLSLAITHSRIRARVRSLTHIHCVRVCVYYIYTCINM